MFQLPNEVISKIYKFDNTFHEKFQKVIHQVNFQVCIRELQNEYQIQTHECEFCYKTCIQNLVLYKQENLMDFDELYEGILGNEFYVNY